MKSATATDFPSCTSQNEIFAAKSSNSGQGSKFKLVVAYDDFGNGICAKQFFRWLEESFAAIINFIPRFMKFEELYRPDDGERLAREVAVADMVVIVAYEDASLSGLVEEWIRTWETTTGIKGCRLLALISSSDRGNYGWTPVQSRLRQVARRTGMKFVLQATPLSGRGCRVAYPNPATTRQAGERRGKWRKSCRAREWPEKAMPRAIGGGMTHDLPHTAVTDAIIHVLRARRRRTSPPTFRLTNDRRTPPPGMNRNHTLTNLWTRSKARM